MVAKDKFLVDLDKPLVCQVGNLGERYEEWLHEPSGRVCCQHFENKFVERSGKTSWKVVAAIWPPVIYWLISLSIQRGIAPVHLMVATGCGMFVWSFFEYLFHRFVYHMKAKSYWAIIYHFVQHGNHHKFPMDTTRMLSPPGITAAYCYVFWNVYSRISTPAVAPALLGGSLLGYLAYDLVHYYIHAAKANNVLIRPFKKHHLVHHYKDQSKGFGVTSPFWDHVFSTSFPSKAA